jgi:hypothetical protein
MNDEESRNARNPDDDSPGRQRLKLLFIPWFASLVITLPGVAYAHYFPAGLYRFFGVREVDVDLSWLAIGWLVYLGLTVTAGLLRRKVVYYYVVYTILSLLLVVTSVGCRVFWSEFNRAF